MQLQEEKREQIKSVKENEGKCLKRGVTEDGMTSR